MKSAAPRRQSVASAKVVDEIIAEAAHDIPPREIDRVRTQAKAGLLMSLESSWGQAGYVARMLSLHGLLFEPSEVIADLHAVKVDEDRAAGSKMLNGPRARATIGVPAVRAA